ncbi:MAG TPA: branched-chain amino acid ABC transporter ATP-binding protein/permease [Bacillota bacterium]
MDYIVSVLTFASIWAVLVLSLNLLVGYAGQVSLGHAAFFGIGAYTAAILSTRYDVGFLPAVAAAMAVTALCGTLLGLPSLRVRHDFLVLATIGLNFIVVGTLQYVEFFGGAMGIVGIPSPEILGLRLRGVAFLLVCIAAAVAAAWVSHALTRTWGGLALFAVRDDEEAAASVGVSQARYKIGIFTLSGAVAGLAGALYAPVVGTVFPNRFGFVESVSLLSMLVFGGVGTVRGAIVGGVVLKALPEYLRFGGEYRYALYGVLLVLIILFQPQGILGDGAWLWERVRTLLAGRRARTGGGDVDGTAAAAGRGARRVAGRAAGSAAGGAEEPVAARDLDAASGGRGGAGRVLEVRHVSVQFGGLRALDGVSLRVHSGEVLGLIGPNGAGKSTLFNVITGYVTPTSGDVLVDGRSLLGLRPEQVARRGIARTFQIVRPLASLDLDHNIVAGFGMHRYGRSAAFLQRFGPMLPRARALAHDAGIAQFGSVRAGQAPIGVLRRLEVARAVATGNPFILLDEPAAGLTHEETEQLAGLVRRLAKRGKGVILVEHNMHFAMSVCDRVVVLAAGKVLADGSPDEVRKDPRVIEVYLGREA